MIKRTNKKNSNRKTISEMIKRRRVFKEQEDRKEINTMQDLVDYLQNDYHLVYDTSLDDLQELGFDFWNDAIDTGGRCVLNIDAHVDDRDKVWFGITDFKVGYFDDMDYNEWAKSILKWNNISEKDILSEDDINEMVGNAVDDMLRNDDIYVDYFSKDISLPCDKKDIDNVIRENKERIEDNIYRAEKRLFDEIESICQKKGIIVESKRTGKRKPLKEARPYVDPKNISREGIQARKELIKIANDILNVIKNEYNGHNIQFSKWMQIQCEYLQEAAKEYEKAMKDF